MLENNQIVIFFEFLFLFFSVSIVIELGQPIMLSGYHHWCMKRVH